MSAETQTPKKTSQSHLNDAQPAQENSPENEQNIAMQEACEQAASDIHATPTPLAQLQEEAAKYKDQWIRTAAELENNRKRFQRELEDNARYAVTGFARDIVEVVENLIRASHSIPKEARNDNELLSTLGEGVDLTLQEMMKILEKHHIKRIDPLKQKFNHDFHQAVAQIERTDIEPNTVIQVVQAGYTLHERLLRPAMVAVSKAPATPLEKVDTSA